MPSSGVSDGVQSLVTGQYPDANFLAIETSGDGAVNVYSRLQMALFKARQKAQQDMEKALVKTGIAHGDIQKKLSKQNKKVRNAYPEHRCASTAANTVYQLFDN